MGRVTRTPAQESPGDPDVIQLAYLLVQRMTGEIPITPEDREPPETDCRTSDEPEPSLVSARPRTPAD